MAKNIEMQYLNSSGNYEIVYPKVLMTNVTGTLPIANGGTGRTSSPSLLTNLASTSAANILQASPRPGITGILPVSHGGTGASTASGALSKIGGVDQVRYAYALKNGAGGVTITPTRTGYNFFSETMDRIKYYGLRESGNYVELEATVPDLGGKIALGFQVTMQIGSSSTSPIGTGLPAEFKVDVYINNNLIHTEMAYDEVVIKDMLTYSFTSPSYLKPGDVIKYKIAATGKFDENGGSGNFVMTSDTTDYSSISLIDVY